MASPLLPVVAPEITKEDREQKPWKYIGYRGYCRFLASDDDFFFLRRFGVLHARVLLALQDQITVLEDKLNRFDQHAGRKDNVDRHNGSFRQDDQDRPNLISEIHTKLKEFSEYLSFDRPVLVCALRRISEHKRYSNLLLLRKRCMDLASLKTVVVVRADFSDELVLQHSELRSRPSVQKKDLESVKNWLYNKENAIEKAEVAYMQYDSDLAPLVAKSKSSLRRFLEYSQSFRLWRLWRIEPLPLPNDVTDEDRQTHYASDKRIDVFVTFIILLIGVIMLIAPLWILEYVRGNVNRLGVITTFIVLFILLLSLTTVARPFETLAAAAGYSAVMMIFLQIPST